MGVLWDVTYGHELAELFAVGISLQVHSQSCVAGPLSHQGASQVPAHALHPHPPGRELPQLRQEVGRGRRRGRRAALEPVCWVELPCLAGRSGQMLRQKRQA